MQAPPSQMGAMPKTDIMSSQTAKDNLSSHSEAGSCRPLAPVLTFRNCSYVVHVPPEGSWFGAKQPKVLLSPCSGRVLGGQVLAILGPSGAGKSTLLSVLAMESRGGVPSGTVTLNGVAFTEELYRHHAATVPQSDLLWTFLTARQHLYFALGMHQPAQSAAVRESQIVELLNETGLTSCQNTRAGSELVPGLSGGQRRRLSLAVALCKRPDVIFLDEPTSGLDAAAAAAVMNFLKQVAARRGIAVVCTIHQPSANVFKCFNSVCFLSSGRVAYLGAPFLLLSALAEVGTPLPEGGNPAEGMLELINPDFSGIETVDQILTAWDARAPALEDLAIVSLPRLSPPSLRAQIRFLFGRHALLAWRDPTQSLFRIPLTMVLMFFVSLFYIEGRRPGS